MHIKPILAFVAIAFYISCQKPPIIDYELYMGTYRIIDQTIPYPYFIEKNQDMIFWYDYKGVKLDSTIHKDIFKRDDSIALSKNPFKILYADQGKLNIYPLNDSTHFPIHDGGQIQWKNRASFVKIVEGDVLKSVNIHHQLTNNTYCSTSKAYNPNDHLQVIKTFIFTADSLITVLSYSYENETVWSESHTQPYHIFDINGKVFISTTEDLSNPQGFYRVTQANKNKIELRYYIDEYEQIETYNHEKSLKKLDATSYKNCFDGHQGEYYYQSKADIDVTFKKGNEYLIKKISKNAPLDKGDGYIIVHFNINCHGQVGRPGLQQMDKQYKSTKFSLPLIKHIINQVSQLDEWPTTESGYDEISYKDVHSFLMFKIEKGKIIDLCP